MRYENEALLAVFLLVALVLVLLVLIVALILVVALVLVTVVLVVLTIVVLHEMTSFRPIGYRRILNRCAGKYAFFHKKKKTIDKCGDGW